MVQQGEVYSITPTKIQADLWPDKNSCDPVEVAKIYNQSALTYDQNVFADGWDASYDRLRPLLDSLMQSGAKVVLDAGCATGTLVNKYAFPSHVELHGVDISTECLNLAQQSGRYSSLQEADLAEELPFEAGMFDVIVCNGVLGYIDTNKPAHELLRVLKEGGSLLMSFRKEHFLLREYGQLLSQCSFCKVVHEDVFDPFPNNPAYKHDYILVAVQRTATE